MSEPADLVPSGAVAASVWLGYSNIFEQDSAATHVLFLDMERLLTTVSLRYGLRDDLEVGGRLALETTGGGISDTFISNWHQRLGLGNANRARYPADQHDVRLTVPGAGTVLAESRHSLTARDVRLFAKWRFWAPRDGRSVASLKAVAQLPVHRPSAGTAQPHVALMVLARRTRGPWSMHGMLGGFPINASTELDPLLRSAAAFALFGVERSLGGSLSAITQFEFATGVLQGFADSELDGNLGNVVFGLAGDIGPEWRWQASFQEDVPPNTPAVDFTLGLEISRRW